MVLRPLLFFITKFLLEKPVKFEIIQGFLLLLITQYVIPFISETINRISLLAIGLDFSCLFSDTLRATVFVEKNM